MKQYYNLKEVGYIVDLKKRQLMNRIKKVKIKYENKPELLKRNKREWRIHKSIIFEFDRKRVTKSERLMRSNTLVTVSPDGHYDVESNMEILKKINEELNKNSSIPIKIEYFIQQGELGGKNHIHFITNLTMDYEKKLRRYANYYTQCNVDVRPVYEVHELIAYLRREVKLQGVLRPDNVPCISKSQDTVKKAMMALKA